MRKKPQTLDHLEDNIHRVIADIRPQMLEKSSKIGRPDWTISEPDKHARRHVSQLSEFERGLIIGMKTAGLSTRRVAEQVDRLECAV
ncbi:hypothetical protein TNCV_2040821 [Trichonephila clavipes]|nr:hypothetical protein TNCV_2040821 [Trichonephila clavipes]